ncbi:golgin subfamily A member 2-like isoform X2 [Fukomys damarensis]|uniref:golgin subfamily A member 2-like isoform X2 n=1 Tax=Fukomys damarensis TaxID=885580 RepID=UPI00053F6C6D|nr:golgin subfamily A member 2-like isoform X2 [Fukomys damarensis]
MEERPVEAPGSNTTIPEDSGSSEALEHQAPLPRRLRQQKGQCQRLAHLAALTQDTPGHGAPTPRSTHGRAAAGGAAAGGRWQVLSGPVGGRRTDPWCSRGELCSP